MERQDGTIVCGDCAKAKGLAEELQEDLDEIDGI